MDDQRTRPRPPSRTRRSVLAAGLTAGVGLLTALAGCLDRGDVGAGDPTTADATTTGDGGSAWWQDAERTVSYAHRVSLENHHDTAHAVTVHIERADGRVVHDRRYDVRPDAARTVFDFSTLAPSETGAGDPDQRSYTVSAWFGDDTPSEPRSATIEMDECHGNVIVSVAREGELQVIYSIC